MLIYGKNVLQEIPEKNIKKVYIARKDYIELLDKKNIKYTFVDNKFLDKLVNGVHQGVVIDVHEYEYKDLKDIKSDKVLLLDHLEDPHNFGAIIRSAVAAGFTDIIIPKDRSVSVNNTVMKVSAGTLSKVNIVMVTNLVNSIKKLKEKNYFVYTTDMNGIDYKTLDYDGKILLIIGNEGKGVSRLVKEIADFTIKINMDNNVESLNASVAAALLMFEMRG